MVHVIFRNTVASSVRLHPVTQKLLADIPPELLTKKYLRWQSMPVVSQNSSFLKTKHF